MQQHQHTYTESVGDNPYCSCDSISIGDINHVLLGCERHRNKIDRLYLNIKGKNDFPIRSDILLASLCEGGPIADFIIKHIIHNINWLPIITEISLESVTTG